MSTPYCSGGSPPQGWDAAEPLFLFSEDGQIVVVVDFRGSGWERRTPRVRQILRSDLRQVVVSPQSEVQPGGQYF